MLGTCEAVGALDAATGPAFSAVLRDFIDHWDELHFERSPQPDERLRCVVWLSADSQSSRRLSVGTP
jgi:hypothetical protein